LNFFEKIFADSNNTTRNFFQQQQHHQHQHQHQQQSNSPLVHPATCDCCKERIIGERRKCETCPDYDLCDTCFKINQEKPFHAHSFKLITKEYYFEKRRQFCQQRCGKQQTESQTEVKKESPKSEVESPKVEQKTPKVEQKSPQTESPKVESKVESPKVEQKSPVSPSKEEIIDEVKKRTQISIRRKIRKIE